MDNDEEILNGGGLFDPGEPGADDLASEDELSDEELAITADNVDAFADVFA